MCGAETTEAGREAQTKAAISHQLSDEQVKALRECPFPKLVLHGAADELIKPVHGQILAERIGAKLLMYENTGHGITVQKRRECNDEIEKHVRAAQQLFATATDADDNDQETVDSREKTVVEEQDEEQDEEQVSEDEERAIERVEASQMEAEANA